MEERKAWLKEDESMVGGQHGRTKEKHGWKGGKRKGGKMRKEVAKRREKKNLGQKRQPQGDVVKWQPDKIQMELAGLRTFEGLGFVGDCVCYFSGMQIRDVTLVEPSVAEGS